jgi:hypothetical protein
MESSKICFLLLLILILLTLVLIIILRKKYTENYHELNDPIITTQTILNDIKKCSSCNYCNFENSSQEYIVGRCIQQHMLCPEDLDFKPPDPGCNPHNILAKTSGCANIINNKLDSINSLKQNYDNNKDKFEAINIKTNSENSQDKTNFESILKSFGGLV